MPRAKRGFTLIEILIATAVAVLIMGAITSVFYYLLVIPPQQTDQLNAENQLRLSLDWIQNDGVQAHSFTPGKKPCPTPTLNSSYYGFFSSYADPGCTDADEGCSEIHIAYRYGNASKQLIREKVLWEETSDCGTTNTTTIAFNIVDMGDVNFYCGEGFTECDGRNPITVNMTVTLNEASQNKVRKEISITDTRYIEMRAEK